MMLGIYYEHMLAAARQREATLPALCAKVRALGYEAVAPQAAHIVRDAGLLPMLSSAGLRAEGIYERFLFEDKAQTAQQTAQVLAASERAGARYLLAVLPMLRAGEADLRPDIFDRRAQCRKSVLPPPSKGKTRRRIFPWTQSISPPPNISTGRTVSAENRSKEKRYCHQEKRLLMGLN